MRSDESPKSKLHPARIAMASKEKDVRELRDHLKDVNLKEWGALSSSPLAGLLSPHLIAHGESRYQSSSPLGTVSLGARRTLGRDTRSQASLS